MALEKLIFLKIPCLSEHPRYLSGAFLRREWFTSADQRYLGEVLNTLIQRNRQLINFLGVNALIYNSGKKSKIGFRTSNFIGTIPLTSPTNGKQIGDLIVTPRFITKDEDLNAWANIVQILNLEIQPEFIHSLPLRSNKLVKPPYYLICAKFLKQLEKLLTSKWVKFQVVEIEENAPRGRINWKSYIRQSHDPQKKLVFPSRKNVITSYHLEFSQILFVYFLAVKEINSSRTPIPIRIQLKSTLDRLNHYLSDHEPTPVSKIAIHQSDFPNVKEIKSVANKVLQNHEEIQTAWRIDGSLLFEKFIQFIFREISKDIGGYFISNPKIQNHQPSHPYWTLSYLEPDGIFRYKNQHIIVDAKYKPHMLNQKNSSDILKESHRHDIHQILAYSSFFKSEVQLCILAYPAKKFRYSTLNYHSQITDRKARVLLLGLPMDKNQVDIFKSQISNLIKRNIL